MSLPEALTPRRDPELRHLAHTATRRGSWFVTIALVLLVFAALALVGPIVQGSGWYLPIAAAVAGTLFVVQAMRQLTGALWVCSVTAAALLLVCVLVLSQPQRLGSVLTAPVERIEQFTEQLMSDQPPLHDSAAVTLLLGTVAVALALLTDALAQTLRLPALAPICLAPFAIAPTAVGLPPADWQYWVLLLLALVLFLALGHRWLQLGDDEARAAVGFTADGRASGGLTGALTTGIAAMVIAALIAVLLPAPSGALWGLITSKASLATNRVNPIIDLGDDLRRSDPVTLLRYATSQTSGVLPYLTLTTLTTLDAQQEWQPNAAGFTEPVIIGVQPNDPDLQPGATTFQISANIVLEPGVSAYLPRFDSLNELRNLTGSYLRDPNTGDLRSATGEAHAQSYLTNSTIVRPSSVQISTASLSFPNQLAAETQLPDVPALTEIRAAMNSVVDPNASPYAQALQLQSWFTSGAFSYSELAPAEQGYDGSSIDMIAQFLQRKSGYCVHFASSMAVMGRLLGIPTRIQIGFTPGAKESVNALGQSVYAVTTDDLHAWAELWVPGYGWVPFETTPAEGIGSSSLEPNITGQPRQSAEQTTAPAPIPTTPIVEGAGSQRAETPALTPHPSSPTEQNHSDDLPAALPRWGGVALSVFVFLLACTLVALLPALIRRARRASRMREVRAPAATPVAASEAAWRELLDTACDFGIAISQRQTTGQQLTQLTRTLNGSSAVAAAKRLAAARNAAHFADPARCAVLRAQADDVQEVREGLSSAATRAQRRAARWLPYSAIPPRIRAALLRRNHRSQRDRDARHHKSARLFDIRKLRDGNNTIQQPQQKHPARRGRGKRGS